MDVIKTWFPFVRSSTDDNVRIRQRAHDRGASPWPRQHQTTAHRTLRGRSLLPERPNSGQTLHDHPTVEKTFKSSQLPFRTLRHSNNRLYLLFPSHL